MGEGVPHLTFESADVPPGEGRRRWEALIGAYDVVLPEGRDEADFAVSSESWLLGDVIISRGRLTPVELVRTAERIAADGRDSLTFGLVTRGHLAGDFDGRLCELRPGQVCAIDFARPWRARSAPAEFILVSVPRPAIAALAPQADDVHGRLLGGATARILIEHFIALVRHLPQASAAEAPIIRRTTLRMIADSLEAMAPAEPSGRGAMESRLAYRVRGYIEARLATPAELSPAQICAALGVTRPTLYRAFRRSGGVMSYIQRRRLEAVHVRLCDPSETRPVSELALAAGFSSHAHFSTAFRQRFGYAPREARLGGGAPGGGALQFRNWLLELSAASAPNETLAKVDGPISRP